MIPPLAKDVMFVDCPARVWTVLAVGRDRNHHEFGLLRAQRFDIESLAGRMIALDDDVSGKGQCFEVGIFCDPSLPREQVDRFVICKGFDIGIDAHDVGAEAREPFRGEGNRDAGANFEDADAVKYWFTHGAGLYWWEVPGAWCPDRVGLVPGQ